MELNLTQLKVPQTIGSSLPKKTINTEIISLDECKKYVGDLNLSDQRIIEIRNSVIGIVDSVINAYLENFG
jgi:hypothetical protein